MNEFLTRVIKSSEHARSTIMTKEKGSIQERQVVVSEANAISNANRAIIGAHMIDLRERILVADLQDREQGLRAIEGSNGEPVGDS